MSRCICCDPLPVVQDMTDRERQFMAGAAMVFTMSITGEAPPFCKRHASMFANVMAGVQAGHDAATAAAASRKAAAS